MLDFSKLFKVTTLDKILRCVKIPRCFVSIRDVFLGSSGTTLMWYGPGWRRNVAGAYRYSDCRTSFPCESAIAPRRLQPLLPLISPLYVILQSHERPFPRLNERDALRMLTRDIRYLLRVLHSSQMHMALSKCQQFLYSRCWPMKNSDGSTSTGYEKKTYTKCRRRKTYYMGDRVVIFNCFVLTSRH